MRKPLADLRPAYVVGIGLHKYQAASNTPYVTLGLTAIREALADSGLGFDAVESAYTGTALLGMAPGRAMLRHLGASGLPIAQIENASASGSTAFRQACLEVASGVCDVALAVGVDKPGPIRFAHDHAGVSDLVTGMVAPFAHFALLAHDYMTRHGVTPEQVAAVSVKNFRNAQLNPYAQRPKARTLEEVMAGPQIAGTLTRLQCCPVGEGAAAAIVVSEDALVAHGLDPARAIKVLSSVSRSERVYEPGRDPDTELTHESLSMACAQAGVLPSQLDVVEFHDAFSIEELLYVEALGLCRKGEAARLLAQGAFDIGGQCAVSASGGLIGMGHPIGPTGVGQVCEVVRQLRHEAGPRQHPNARFGLTHMVGIGSVCVAHVLARPD
jgi:acetyl-CoA acetyltransferase